LRSQLKPLQEIPFVNRVPVVATLSENKMLATTERLSRSIVETTSGAQKIIDDVETALTHSDPTVLRDYMEQIRELDEKTKELLASAKQIDALEATSSLDNE
jgi:hypothetical protein